MAGGNEAGHKSHTAGRRGGGWGGGGVGAWEGGGAE